MTDDPDSLAIVAAIGDLAGTIRLVTVAEGVESMAQLALPQQLRCPSGQGYLWSRPLPMGALVTPCQEQPGGRFPVSTGPAAAAAPRPAGEAAPRPAGEAAPRPAGEAVTASHGLIRLRALHREGASLSTIAAALDAEGFRTRAAAAGTTLGSQVVADAAYPELWRS